MLARKCSPELSSNNTFREALVTVTGNCTTTAWLNFV
jgi:hypothetical protein